MAAGDKTPIKWEDADFAWDLAPDPNDILPGFGPSIPIYTWDDVALVEEALVGVGGGGDMDEMPWTQWDDDKKKRLIKLICKVKGKTYKETLLGRSRVSTGNESISS